MKSQKLLDALNAQVKHELYSGYVYLSMSAYCSSKNLNGFANWLTMQSKEEVSHAMKIYQFILDRGKNVKLEQLDEPPHDFGTPTKLFEEVLKHERKVTGLIHDLYELAISEKDYPAQVMLQWFIEEQVEEEQQAEEILQQLKVVGDQGSVLFMIDRKLAERAGAD